MTVGLSPSFFGKGGRNARGIVELILNDLPELAPIAAGLAVLQTVQDEGAPWSRAWAAYESA